MGKTDVAVLGRSAVGKSVLLERLQGLPGQFDWRPPDLSRKVETCVLRLKRPVIARTIPGQISRERDAGIHEVFSSHRSLEGLIYVTDWGYTDIREEAVRRDYIENKGLDTIGKLRKFNLDAEIRDLEIVSERIRELWSRCKRPKWIMIACNKTDLYHKTINEAQDYYHPETKSKFTDVLDRLRNEVGRTNIECRAVPVSCWLEAFNWNGKTKNIELDENGSRALFENFFNVLQELNDIG